MFFQREQSCQDSPFQLSLGVSFDLEHIVDLGLFARVVDLQSFSAAARQTGIAKSAVSRRIALLERRLGVQLLRRSTRAVEVTSDGARFFEHCRRVIAAAADAEESVKSASTTTRGLVRVSAPVTFSQMYLARAFAQFQLSHPELEINLTADDRFVDPVAGEFDLVVRITRLKNEEFVAKCLLNDRLVVAGSPGYFERCGRPRRSEDLVHHHCLHYTLVERGAEWRFLGGDKRPVGLSQTYFASNDGTVLREAMLAGLGLVVLPHFMVARDVARGQAELVLEGKRSAGVGIYAVVASSRGLPLRLRILIEFLETYFAKLDFGA